MVDFHAHCEYSIDAEGTIDQYAQAALKAGLSHICFTTHCDLDPARLEHDGRVRLGGSIVDVNSGWRSHIWKRSRLPGNSMPTAA